MSLDYDLFVINAENKDTTPEQLRDCIYDALQRIDERLNLIESFINRFDEWAETYRKERGINAKENSKRL